MFLHIAYKYKIPPIYLSGSTRLIYSPQSCPSFHFLDLHQNSPNYYNFIFLCLNAGSAYNMQNKMQCLIICCLSLSLNGFMQVYKKDNILKIYLCNFLLNFLTLTSLSMDRNIHQDSSKTNSYNNSEHFLYCLLYPIHYSKHFT